MHPGFIVLSLLSAGPPATGWQRPALSPRLQPDLRTWYQRAVPVQPRSSGRLVVGGVIGATVGLGVGLLAYSALDRQDPCFASDCDSDLGRGLVVATAGVTIGIPTGVHLANSRRGSYLKGLLGSTAIAAAGWGVAALADDARWLLAIPVAQITGAVLIERGSTTARR